MMVRWIIDERFIIYALNRLHAVQQLKQTSGLEPVGDHLRAVGRRGHPS
jgi:hypothetical protein